MGRSDAGVLLVGVIALLACATQASKPPEHAETPRTAAAAEATGASRSDSRAREVTWAQYYTEVEQRVRQRGGMVIWINPPRTIARAVPPSNATTAADPRSIPQIR
jgi:hypothetical protein